MLYSTACRAGNVYVDTLGISMAWPPQSSSFRSVVAPGLLHNFNAIDIHRVFLRLRYLRQMLSALTVRAGLQLNDCAKVGRLLMTSFGAIILVSVHRIRVYHIQFLAHAVPDVTANYRGSMGCSKWTWVVHVHFEIHAWFYKPVICQLCAGEWRTALDRVQLARDVTVVSLSGKYAHIT